MTAPIHAAPLCAMPTGLITKNSVARRRLPRRAGFTVIELLVAMVITLIMMGAVATLFGTITGGVQDARATIEMTERLRSATSRLQQDLQGVTANMLPSLRPETDSGYFEIVEGLQCDRLVDDPDDSGALMLNLSDASYYLDPKYMRMNRFGDCDDALMFTTRTRGEPFIGKVPVSAQFPNGTIQSQVAEVIYFIAPSPTSTAINPQFSLYRRCLLVLPSFQIPDGTTPQQMLEQYDISVRMVPGTNPQKWVANSLGDLTKRENRAAHSGLAPNVGKFPWAVDFAQVVPFSGVRYGEDVILSNVLAFDAQVWEPNCPLQFDASGIALTPRDPGYDLTTYSTSRVYGAFIDLGCMPTLVIPNAPPGTPPFPPMPFRLRPDGMATTDRSGLRAAYVNPTRCTYDTFSSHYENNWIDSNNNGTPEANEPGNEFDDGKADQGTNGFDDDTVTTDPGYGVVDDPGEAETAPPYAAPLRGIRVTIRVYEPDSRQVREVNIEQDFVPE